jgi:hypothetical protein
MTFRQLHRPHPPPTPSRPSTPGRRPNRQLRPAARPQPPLAARAAVHPLAAVVVAGWVLGAVDGALAGAPKSRGAVILFSAVLGSVATFLIALPVWLGATLASRVGPVRRLIDKLRAKLSPSSDHEAQLRLYAFGLAALAVAAFVSLAAAFVFPKLFDLQELDLAKQLAVVAVAVLVASSLSAP